MSFFSKFEEEFKELFKITPTYVHYAQSMVAFAAPIATALLSEFDPALVPVATPIIAKVQTSLTTVSVLVGDGTAPASVSAALVTLQTNLQSLLNLGGIKNPDLQKQVTTDVTLVLAEIQTVIGMLPVTK